VIVTKSMRKHKMRGARRTITVTYPRDATAAELVLLKSGLSTLRNVDIIMVRDGYNVQVKP
jgi:hypothetical protein